MSRPVDAALADERPPKVTIRQKWTDYVAQALIRRRQSRSDSNRAPIYLTLCGRNALDIAALVSANLLRRSENGAIHPDDVDLVVAVERSTVAAADLQQRWPGLRIREQSIEDLLRSDKLTTWPTGVDRHYCQASVINLDFDGPIECRASDGEFPVLMLIAKLARLHHELADDQSWLLCLTAHSDIVWPPGVVATVQRFLVENCEIEPVFEAHCRHLFGSPLFERLRGDDVLNVDSLSAHERQLLLMAFVPKRIARLLTTEGWLVATEENLYYGRPPDEAPMVTWVIRFLPDTRATSQPDALYKASVREVLSKAGEIDMSGDIRRLEL